MSDYQTVLSGFTNYFGAIAQVSGGLVGLVFIALTFNIRALGLKGDPVMQAFAQQTLSDFLLVLVLSLFMLVPDVPANNLGFVLVSLGGAGILRAGRSLWVARRGVAAMPRRTLLQRLGLSILGNSGILAAGFLMFPPHPNLSAIVSFLVSAPITLMLSGCRSAWLLVLHQAD